MTLPILRDYSLCVLCKFKEIAENDRTDVQILELHQRHLHLLEDLPPDTRLTRTQIGWMISFPDGITHQHERYLSACATAYWKHHEKKD